MNFRTGSPPVGRVRVNYYGAMGNNLFQYCYGRIVASILGFELVARPIEGFPETARPVPGSGPVLPDQMLESETLGDFEGDLARSLVNRMPRTIEVHGHFQLWDFYRGHAEQIRSDWLRMDLPRPEIGEEELVVHVRGGDYWFTPDQGNVCSPAPVSYYAGIIEKTQPARVRVVTDSPDDPVVARLAELFPITVQSRNRLDDFATMVAANRLVMAASTFSWWAAMLSDACEVHLPLIGIWHPESSTTWVDLTPDQPRYVLHDLGSEDWNGSEEDRRRILDV